MALHFNNNRRRAEGRRKSLWELAATEKNKIRAEAQETRFFKAVAGSFTVKTSPNLLFLDTYLVIPNAELENVHPLIKRLYSKEMLTKAVDIPLAGRISHAIVNWKKLTLKQDILSKGLHLTIYQHTFSTKKSQFVVNEQEANCSCGFRIKDVEERGNKANSACSWGVSEQLIPCGEKKTQAIAQ